MKPIFTVGRGCLGVGEWFHKIPMSPLGHLVVHPHLTAADALQRSSGLARMCMLREQKVELWSVVQGNLVEYQISSDEVKAFEKSIP